MIAYTSAQYNVLLVGPTLFARVVTVAVDIAVQAFAQGQQKYCLVNNHGKLG